jgi:hypothetical protein
MSNTMYVKRLPPGPFQRKKTSPGITKRPATETNQIRIPIYDLGEAVGLAFSFFAPFSPLAAFTSTSLAVMV